MKTPTPTRIGIAVVVDDGRFLVGTRPHGVPLAGSAEFPGGKCRHDESPCECAVRECREETGLAVTPDRLLLNVPHAYLHDTVDLHFWLCRPAKQPSLDAAGDFRWVSAAELESFSFPMANRALVGLLAAGLVTDDQPPAQTDSIQDA